MSSDSSVPVCGCRPFAPICMSRPVAVHLHAHYHAFQILRELDCFDAADIDAATQNWRFARNNSFRILEAHGDLRTARRIIAPDEPEPKECRDDRHYPDRRDAAPFF